MFAGSVTSRTSTPATSMRTRVRLSLSSYSPSGNAGIAILLGRAQANHQGLEDPLRGVEVVEVDPLVRPVRRLRDVTGAEQHAWYPGLVNEEAGVARRAPGGDLRGKACGRHRGLHRPDEGVLWWDRERRIVRTFRDGRIEPRQVRSRAGDRFVELAVDRLRSLARVEPAVDLDLAAVGDDVGPRAAVDRAHGQARRAEDAAGSRGKPPVLLLELEHDPRRGGDGVASERRFRRVRRLAPDRDPEVEQAAIAGDEVQSGRLRQHRDVGLDAPRDQGARPGRVLLLTDHGREDDIPGGLAAGAAEGGDGAQACGQAALHVARAASVEPAADDLCAIRIARPAFADRDGVEVAGEEEAGPVSGGPMSEDVAAPGRDLLGRDLEAGFFADRRELGHHRGLVSGRRRNADQALEDRAG